MECSSCGTAVSADAQFCGGCGAHLRRSGDEARTPPTAPGHGILQCPRCRRRNETGSDFCYFCGLPLEDGTGSPSRRKTEAPELFSGSIEPADSPGAGFWLRFCAAAIDGILLILLTLVAAWSVGLPIVFSLLAISLLYHSLGVSVWSTTVGKRLLGLYVRRSDGSKCGFRRAVRRWFSSIVSALILFVGYIMIGLRRDKRGLHDLICDTVVVSRPSSRT